MTTPTTDQTGRPVGPEGDIKYVVTALTYFGPAGATIPELEHLTGAPFGPETQLGEGLTEAVARGTVEQNKDRFRVASPQPREVSLVRPEIYRTVTEIVSTHIPGTDPDDVAEASELIAHLQRYVDDVLSAALGAYIPVVDGDGNHLFIHKTCAWQEWGTGNEAPARCRRCEMRTDAWEPVYSRSNATIRRDRTPSVPSEPALIAALRGAFSDVDIIALSLVVADDPQTEAGRRLRRIIDETIGGL